MPYTTMTYRAPNGDWAWMILDDQRTLINSGRGYDSEAQAEFTADCYLSNHIAQDGDPYAGMRADGEPLTGIDAIDNDPSIVHPGNDTPESSPC